jgi:phosphoribosylanthranilate isomerase
MLPGRVLFEGPVSGSGQTTDWDAAAQLARRCEIILAGGLNPLNVGFAMRQVRPFGVDVSSGVESAPGIKSADQIEKFVAAARVAALELNS